MSSPGKIYFYDGPQPDPVAESERLEKELAEEKQKNAEFFKRIQQLESQYKMLLEDHQDLKQYNAGMKDALKLLGGKKP